MDKYKELEMLLLKRELSELQISYFKEVDKFFIYITFKVNEVEQHKVSSKYNTLSEASNELITYFKKEYK